MKTSKSILIGNAMAATFMLAGCGDDLGVKIKDLTPEKTAQVAAKMTAEENQLYAGYVERNSSALIEYNAKKEASQIMGKKGDFGPAPEGLDTNITVRDAINAERKFRNQ